MTLKDKRIIVLGGTSGIGLAVAEAAATDGAQVLVASSGGARVKRALTTLPASAEGHVLDLSNATAIEAFFDAVGPLDHLVYTAGESLKLSPLAEGDIASARHFFELRYWGAFMAARWGHRQIRTGGSIVFTSGVAGARPGPGWSVAASICGAMEGLTRALAVELAPVRVNIVSPGVVKTPLWREMPEEARESLYASEARRLPVGHVADAQEVAEGYLYLMRQTFVSGQTLVIDGGGLSNRFAARGRVLPHARRGFDIEESRTGPRVLDQDEADQRLGRDGSSWRNSAGSERAKRPCSSFAGENPALLKEFGILHLL